MIWYDTSDVCADGQNVQCIVGWQWRLAQSYDDSIPRGTQTGSTAQANVPLQRLENCLRSQLITATDSIPTLCAQHTSVSINDSILFKVKHLSQVPQIRPLTDNVHSKYALTYLLTYLKSIAFHGKPISELWSVTCHMKPHSVTCHKTQANAPCLNPSQTDQNSTDLPLNDKRLSWP